MGTWSQEFINLADVLVTDVRNAGGLARWIDVRLGLAASTSGRKLVLYFPPRPRRGSTCSGRACG